MDAFRVISIKKNMHENNQQQANLLREMLDKKGLFLLNVMSSPGSGKTTTLVRTIESLPKKCQIRVIEADIDSDVDAQTIFHTGTPVVQLHTGGMCHLTANMVKEGIENLDCENVDLIILENIGNLICTASYDTGAHKNVMILSVPEGDDKPLKYPKMFTVVDALIINKIDVLDRFDFNIDLVSQRARELRPNLEIFPLSAKTGEGVQAWVEWLLLQMKKHQ